MSLQYGTVLRDWQGRVWMVVAKGPLTWAATVVVLRGQKDPSIVWFNETEVTECEVLDLRGFRWVPMPPRIDP